MVVTVAQISAEALSEQTMAQISLFLPRIVASIVVLIVGVFLAKAARRIIVRVLSTIRLSSLVEQTPLDLFLKNADAPRKIEEVFGSIVYWLVMLVVINTSVAILGLQSVAGILDRLLSYIPNVISAIMVLFIGVLLAGAVESLVKGAVKSIDGYSSRLFGKISSYLVISISVLVAISELGIASEFILILFVGFVLAISLGIGLSLGLGGQDVVKMILNEWYERTKKEIKE